MRYCVTSDLRKIVDFETGRVAVAFLADGIVHCLGRRWRDPFALAKALESVAGSPQNWCRAPSAQTAERWIMETADGRLLELVKTRGRYHARRDGALLLDNEGKPVQFKHLTDAQCVAEGNSSVEWSRWQFAAFGDDPNLDYRWQDGGNAPKEPAPRMWMGSVRWNGVSELCELNWTDAEDRAGIAERQFQEAAWRFRVGTYIARLAHGCEKPEQVAWRALGELRSGKKQGWANLNILYRVAGARYLHLAAREPESYPIALCGWPDEILALPPPPSAEVAERIKQDGLGPIRAIAPVRNNQAEEVR